MNLVFIVADESTQNYIDLFLAAKQHVRPATLYWYRNSLKQFKQATQSIQPQWPPQTQHLDVYFATFSARKLSLSSCDDYYRAIRAWLNWLKKHRHIHLNPLNEYDLPFKKKRRGLPKAPPERDMKKIFGSFGIQGVDRR